MGHNRMLTLPATKSWQQVARLLAGDATDIEVVAEAGDAARSSIERAMDDPMVTEAVRQLVLIADAARADAFEEQLANAGFEVRKPTDLLSLLEAAGRRLDVIGGDGRGQSDLGELARRALLGSLHEVFGARLPGLFGEGPGDLARAARHFSSPGGFSILARHFFTQMTTEVLGYWLDRTLSAQIGPHQRFSSLAEREEFERSLRQFSVEATRIIKEFSTGWFASHSRKGVEHLGRSSAGYGAVAFRKIGTELSRKRGGDA